jgi:uncharacterized membrane protein HdeD (DUF308 family)
MATDRDIKGRSGIAEMVVRDLFERAWWAVALRGLIGVVIGIVAVTWPRVTLAMLLGILGVYLVVDGILTIAASLRASHAGRRWWPYLLEGVVSLGIGALAFYHPMTIAFVVLLLVAFRCFVTGLVEIATAVWLRRETNANQWFLWLAGLVSIAFGVALLFMPGAGALTLVWLAGFYTMVFGILEIVTAFMVKGVARRRFEPQPT